ncbi:hypothetical protein O8C89_03600 [Aliarcobacter butzleri]|uniref:hypothetical protein n=1 Tax=Aliarcobacter butzleri TaxID=28197 RepID=UPI00263D3BE1|nr:hypothetical protein [Aliarcobacter butzleri]MDN5079603.1 hypothetical protein [Aliarcobacter butzleri]
MINFNIKEKIPPIENFPDDEIYRVIWAYGSLQKGTTITTVPEIYVLLVNLEYDVSKKKYQLNPYKTNIVKISIAQLDIARYMTIWKGKKRVEDNWEDFNEYEKNKKFRLDSTTSICESYSKKIDEKKYESFFPKEKYKLPYLGNIDDFLKFSYVTFTKISNEEYDVVIPSMELYTSTYTPHEQQIRNKLIQFSLDDTLNDYVKLAKEESSKYIIELYHSKTTTNISFLAYSSLNNMTRQRLSELRSSLENGKLDKYPIILPYHPSSISLQGDGFWIDDKTFFMLRINKYSLPADIEIDNITDEIEVEENNKSNSKNTTISSIKRDLDNYELPVTNNHNPHIRNASLSIISEIELLNDSEHKIENKKKTTIIEKTDNTSLVQNTGNIQNVSSSEADNANDSENTGKLYIKSENTLHQLKALDLFLNSINLIKDNNKYIDDEKNSIKIDELYYLDKDSNLNIDKCFIEFKDILEAKNEKSTFVYMKQIKEHKTEFLGNRKCLVLKICLNNASWFYLIEIERKDDNEGFSGLLFKPTKEFDKKELEDLLMDFINKKGIVKNIEYKNKFVIFKHSVDKINNNLVDSYLRNFKKIL